MESREEVATCAGLGEREGVLNNGFIIAFCARPPGHWGFVDFFLVGVHFQPSFLY